MILMSVTWVRQAPCGALGVTTSLPESCPAGILTIRTQHGLQGNRPADQPALCVFAVELAKRIELVLGFHAFGNHFTAERPGHGDDGLHDGLAAWLVHGSGEALVQLDAIKVEAQQGPQVRIPRAEIIERHFHAGRMAFVDQVLDQAVLEYQTFGDFHLQPITWQVMRIELRKHSLDQAGLLQLSGGYIEGNEGKWRPAALAQSGKHLAHALQHILSDRHDKRGFLGEPDEFDR